MMTAASSQAGSSSSEPTARTNLYRRGLALAGFSRSIAGIQIWCGPTIHPGRKVSISFRAFVENGKEPTQRAAQTFEVFLMPSTHAAKQSMGQCGNERFKFWQICQGQW